jgi:Xaa-Pro dipeptidase
MNERTSEGVSRRQLLGGAACATGSVLATGCRAPLEDAEEEPTMEAQDAQARREELFADLEDRSQGLEPISAEEKAARVQRLAGLLEAQGMDGLLVEPGATLRYLSDVSWGTSERLFALVVLADGSTFWVVPSFEVPRARKRIGEGADVLGWDEHEYAFEPLAAELRRRDVDRLAIDPRARAFVAQNLMYEFGLGSVLPGTGIVRDLRGAKDAHELELMRAANEATKDAILAVSERMQPGITDREFGALIRTAQSRLGLRGVWVLPLFDESASYPHGSPEGRVLEPGDTVLVDTGGSYHGYQSDITRTWVHGAAPGPELTRGWNAVREAQRRAFETIRPGLPCKAIDAAARAAIEAAGYGSGYETFAHRLGHGIGLEGHEEPYLDGGSEVILAPGMTFSDEPGIYLPGEFGVRIEDIVVVTADGADVFGDWQRDPSSPGS